MDVASVPAIQTWMIKASLAITAVIFVFLTLAPAFGYPLEYSQSFRIIQILIPVFIGYLATATTFVVGKRRPSARFAGLDTQVALVTKGPIYIFLVGMLGLFVAFGVTNRAGAPAGTGMTIDTLATTVSVLLALLSATTGVVVAHVFPTSSEPANPAGAAGPAGPVGLAKASGAK